ncbi:XRE family transcriptional regulator [Rouxiella badensis]|uniref:XRE family transcriptional regulator n=1 Tax=Rouxiella badensis TaxID=1646377 RepID=UPI001D14EB8B|nr:XRE family transcriptional regulator [Rouxiella badensis]MCC3720556.1 XRE family transcriptional regulator [Rouxiella badensis]MCC3730395.1 XRE family transcriptional regulator [Rouxiella badensis]WAT06464.1 XRE family transcriptional regulator [Rouxiella badensis]
MSTLSERLNQAMSETGFESQAKLESASGVKQSVISKILTGKSITSRHTGNLAAAMGISADWLINGVGSMKGSGDSPLPKVDVSKQVRVFDENGDTGEAISWFNSVPAHYRAYIMKRNSGIAQAPMGAIVIVDPTLKCSTDDLVLTIINGYVSVFRYHISGSGDGFLSVDDARVPLAPVSDESSVIGTVIQSFIPDLTK